MACLPTGISMYQFIQAEEETRILLHMDNETVQGQSKACGRTLDSDIVVLAVRCHGLRVYAVCVCNKVRLPGTGQSAHVIGGSRFTRPASNSRRTLLN